MTDATTIAASDPGLAEDQRRNLRGYLVVREATGSRVIDVDDGAEIVVGRASDVTVSIDDPKASRRHARFVRHGATVEVADLGSRNGTRLNGRPLGRTPVPVGSGDVVGIGDVDIWVGETAAVRDREPAAGELPGVVISDPASVAVFELVRKVAPMPTTVLVLGETGVGKDVVAEQIHRQSARAAGPFVRLNCGSLPETLLESELFGYERGAFTGADKRKLGYLEAADGGTLFLDEVGELGPSTQTKLLRVLEDRRFMRVGGRQEIASDLRIVAATNRDLEDDVKTGKFRQDLYFRLSAFLIRVPPLRQRPVEIDLLAELFARQLAKRMTLPTPRLAPDALATLRAHDWPGNVRELRNAIEHAVVLATAGVVTVEHLPESVRRRETPGVARGAMRSQLAETERAAIRAALDAEVGNQTRAARRLGISRRALLYKLEKYGLKD